MVILMVIECTIAGRGVVAVVVMEAKLLRCTISAVSLGSAIAALAGFAVDVLAFANAQALEAALEAAKAWFTEAATATITTAMALSGALLGGCFLGGSTIAIATEAGRGGSVASKAVITTMGFFSGSLVTPTWGASGDGSREDCENEGLHDMNLKIFFE